MKKIISLFIIGVLMFNLVGCGKKKSISRNSIDVNETYEEYIPDDVNRKNEEIEYYSCLVKKGDHIEINVSVQEFLDKYNELKPSYEDKNYGELEFSDFFYIETNTDSYGNSVKSYGCSQTIFGNYSDLVIALNVNGEMVNSLSFGIKNGKYIDMYYSEPYFEKIILNYQLLISSLIGCSMNTSKKYVDEIFNNGKKDDEFITYDKGLMFVYDTSNTMADWYRIMACTEKEYEDNWLLKIKSDKMAGSNNYKSKVASSSNKGIKFYDYKNNELLNQNDMVSAEPFYVSMNSNGDKRWYVRIYFNEDGRKKFISATDEISKYSDENRYISIKVNGDIIACPTINQKLEDDNVIIMGNFDEDSATDLAKKIEDVINEDKSNNDIKYRVRKSVNDSTTQKGAFSDLNNAKNTADKFKNEGYKVYDMNGNVVYTPYNEGNYVSGASIELDKRECHHCSGEGIVYRYYKNSNEPVVVTCDVCKGKGWY